MKRPIFHIVALQTCLLVCIVMKCLLWKREWWGRLNGCLIPDSGSTIRQVEMRMSLSVGQKNCGHFARCPVWIVAFIMYSLTQDSSSRPLWFVLCPMILISLVQKDWKHVCFMTLGEQKAMFNYKSKEKETQCLFIWKENLAVKSKRI